MFNTIEVEALSDQGKKVLIFTVIPDPKDPATAERVLDKAYKDYLYLGIAHNKYIAPDNPFQIVVIE